MDKTLLDLTAEEEANYKNQDWFMAHHNEPALRRINDAIGVLVRGGQEHGFVFVFDQTPEKLGLSREEFRPAAYYACYLLTEALTARSTYREAEDGTITLVPNGTP